jgi:seryl-tRNA synthetase
LGLAGQIWKSVYNLLGRNKKGIFRQKKFQKVSMLAKHKSLKALSTVVVFSHAILV